MNQRIASVFIVLAVVVTLSAGGSGDISAQDSTPSDPLLEMLALIPDTPEIRAEMHDAESHWNVSYMDYQGIVAARPGAAQITSWAEYDTMHDSADEAAQTGAGLWLAALAGAGSGPHFLMQSAFYDRDANPMPNVVGFDFFAVTQGLQYAYPPNLATILAGDFDAAAIAQAFSNRGYTAQEYADGTLWCGPDGCESGQAANMEQVNPANPFGGHLGQEQPLLVRSGYLISSPDYGRIAVYPGLLDGSTPTLADAPDFQAAADAVLTAGTLIQAQFYDPAIFTWDDPALAALGGIGWVTSVWASPDLPEADRAFLRDRADAAYIPLPRYSLVIFADLVDGDDQLVLTGLVYANAETAQTAADAVYARMNEYISIVWRRSLIEMVAYWDGVIERPQLYTHATSGQTVVVIVWRAPLPSPEPLDGHVFMQSSMSFRYLDSMIRGQDLGWLAIGPAETE